MKNFSGITDNLDITTKKYVDDGLAEKANSSDLATVATSGSYNDLSNKLTAGSNISISGNTISATVPTNYVTTDTEQTITSKKTFNGEVKFGSTENFQGYYIKRMLGSLGPGTRYADLDSSYKDGTWHRMWRLRFPSGSSFWGKIKVTLYGDYSSFNASGLMSKSITCNFNTSNIYNNVGCYDGLGVNVEQDFRISEAIWNATASAWEVLIWQKNLRGNNSPVIMLECWTKNNTNYIKAFNGITAQTVELTQMASYSAQRASSTGGTKTVEWATLPVYENPLGEEIATVAMLKDPNTHYTNYLQIKGNNTEAVKFTQNANKTLNFKPGANVSISAVSGEITISSTDTNTATAADNILDGSNSGTEITYKPYTSQQSKLSFDTSTTNPTRTDRLNLNGYLYATKLYSGGKEVFTSHQSIKSINTNNTAAQSVNASEAITGSGTINLHKVSKTGSYNDLLNKPTIPDISGKLDKTTYEWNKEFAAGSNGAISLGRYNIYDTQLTFDISSTTSASMNGKLVIATQNGRICQAKVFGDASGVLVSKIVIYQSAIVDNRSWIEIFCNFDGWSKNKVHIYGVALNSTTVTNQMSSVTFTNGIPSPITSGDYGWSGTIDNDSSHWTGDDGTISINHGSMTFSAKSGDTYGTAGFDMNSAGDLSCGGWSVDENTAHLRLGIDGACDIELGENAGTAGQVLTSQGAGNTPIWANVPKTEVVQTTGTSTTSVMSQKATTDELAKKANLNGGNNFTGPQRLSSSYLFLMGDDNYQGPLLDCFDEANQSDSIFAVHKTGTDAGEVRIGDASATAAVMLCDNAGTSGQVFTSQGSGKTPIWANVPKTEVVQTTGTSTTSVMSQKATTDELAKKANLEGANEFIDGTNTFRDIDGTTQISGSQILLKATGVMGSASLSVRTDNNNEVFKVESDSENGVIHLNKTISLNGDMGTSGQVLTSRGASATPQWKSMPTYSLSGTTLTITLP